MNFDLITKLARLANNNPNENEANLAARKACKLLAEGNFTFTNWSPEPKKQQQQYNPADSRNYRSASNPVDNPFADFFKSREKAWDGFKSPPKQEKTASEKIKEEQEKQYKAREYESRPFTDDLFDMINKIMEERKYQGYPNHDSDSEYWIKEIIRQQQAECDRNPFKSKRQSPFDIPLGFGVKDPFGFNESKPKKEKHPIKCTECGKEFNSAYIGNLFICHQCHWDRYNKEKAK